MTPKLRIIIRAVQIRLDRGEDLEDILDSYPDLTLFERSEIRKQINEA